MFWFYVSEIVVSDVIVSHSFASVWIILLCLLEHQLLQLCLTSDGTLEGFENVQPETLLCELTCQTVDQKSLFSRKHWVRQSLIGWLFVVGSRPSLCLNCASVLLACLNGCCTLFWRTLLCYAVGVAMRLAVSVAHKQLMLVQLQHNLSSVNLSEACARLPFSLSAKNKALMKQHDAVFALDQQTRVYNHAQEGLRLACVSEYFFWILLFSHGLTAVCIACTVAQPDSRAKICSSSENFRRNAWRSWLDMDILEITNVQNRASSREKLQINAILRAPNGFVFGIMIWRNIEILENNPVSILWNMCHWPICSDLIMC